MARTATTTIRIPREVHQHLAKVSAAEGISIGSVIEEALNILETERFWANMAEAYADPVSVQESERELELWTNAAVANDLEKEDWSWLRETR